MVIGFEVVGCLVVARFGLVMVGFGVGHLGVGWVSRWRSSLSHGGDWV